MGGVCNAVTESVAAFQHLHEIFNLKCQKKVFMHMCMPLVCVRGGGGGGGGGHEEHLFTLCRMG